MELTRPYVAAFSSRFLLMLQYRAAAIAGFATQCWWGAIKVMVYAAFYRASASTATPITLGQVITYTWLAQGLLALVPWACDPDVGLAVRSGAVGYDRLRPVDAYALWYARAAGWMTARAAPRAALMLLLAGVALPLLGFPQWGWAPPADAAHAALFMLSLVLVVALSAAIVMLLNICVTATLNDRGVNSLASPFTIILTGNLLPLALYPDWMQRALFFQPFAGVCDIPFRIYTGNLSIRTTWAGIGLQIFWTLALVAVGRMWMNRVMHRLEVQGG